MVGRVEAAILGRKLRELRELFLSDGLLLFSNCGGSFEEVVLGRQLRKLRKLIYGSVLIVVFLGVRASRSQSSIS